MQILLVVLALLALLTWLVFITVLNQLLPALALLVMGSVPLLGILLRRKLAVQSTKLYLTVLVVSIAGVGVRRSELFGACMATCPTGRNADIAAIA